jgi:hypothetical protein
MEKINLSDKVSNPRPSGLYYSAFITLPRACKELRREKSILRKISTGFINSRSNDEFRNSNS